MALNDVKEITVPVNGTNKAVKKIEDANGNIIWGSASAFPYRRLEYIHFSGAEGCNLTVRPAQTNHTGLFSLTCTINPPGGSGYSVIMGCAGDSGASGGAMRILCQTSGTTTGQRVGRNSSTYGYSFTPTANKKYIVRLRCASNNSTYIDYRDGDTNALITGTAHSASISYTSANMPTIQLMRYNVSGSIINNGYAVGNIYKLTKQQTDASSAYLWKMYPVQRKSDGVCGLYNTVNGYFVPMEGTNITDSAAGPTVDEYWDLTDPE